MVYALAESELNNKNMSRKEIIKAKKEKALAFIKAFIKKNGFAPTIQKVSEHLGYPHRTGAAHIINVLVKEGKIKKSDGGGIVLIVENS